MRGEQVVPAARTGARAPRPSRSPRPVRPRRPGSDPQAGGLPRPDPLYKKKRRQHLPLDTPGGRGRPGPGRPSSPVCVGASAEAPRVLRAAQRCRGLGWPLW